MSQSYISKICALTPVLQIGEGKADELHRILVGGQPWGAGVEPHRLQGYLAQLNGALGQFRCWYNHIRPHQNMAGRTPAEVWQGVDIFTNRPRREYYYSAWDGLLTGYYLRL